MVLLTALTLVLAAVAGVAVVGTAPPGDVPEPVVLSASANVDPEDGSVEVAVVHEGGPDLDVRVIDVRIAVDGTRLPHQPSVPFYAATGFASFPSGPFNPVTDPHWEAGEGASLVLTGGNADPVSIGATVRVELYREDVPIATVEATAR